MSVVYKPPCLWYSVIAWTDKGNDYFLFGFVEDYKHVVCDSEKHRAFTVESKFSLDTHFQVTQGPSTEANTIISFLWNLSEIVHAFTSKL